MELLHYNGIDLRVVSTNYVDRTNVRTEDGVDPLYTRWTIDAIVHINPAGVDIQGVNIVERGTSYIAAPPLPNNLPDAGEAPGSMPGVTDNAIRAILMQPRKRLIVVAGGATILDVPRRKPGQDGDVGIYLTDAKNGPFCDCLAIKQIIGSTHFVAHVRFTAHDIEYPGTDQNIVLSNRWTCAEDLDELNYPVREFYGEAILRTNLMHERDLVARGNSQPGQGNPNFNADSLRSFFFFAIPKNYQRENVKVELSSDGSRLTWSFRDVGKCYNLGGNSTIRKIEAFQDSEIVFGTAARAVGQTIQQVGLDVAKNWWNPFSLLSSGLSAPGQMLENGLNNLPKYQVRVSVAVWGDRDAKRKDLVYAALGVCFNRLGLIANAIVSVASTQFCIKQALHEKYVLVTTISEWSDDLNVSLLNVGVGAVTGPAGLFAWANGIERSDSKLEANILSSFQSLINGTPLAVPTTILDQAKGDNPSPRLKCLGNLNLTVALVTQILQNPNQTVPIPTIPMPAN